MRALRSTAPALALVAAAIGCDAPEPTPTGHEFDEFEDDDPAPPANDLGAAAPSGYAVMPCGEDAFGGVSVSIGFDEQDRVLIGWQGANALGVLVTDREAILPAGPGQAVKGTAFWVLSTLDFPAGFRGPAVYGTVPAGSEDVTDQHGGRLGGSELVPGVCYKFSVTNNQFATGSVVRGWE
jgi:hypothetical protein